MLIVGLGLGGGDPGAGVTCGFPSLLLVKP